MYCIAQRARVSLRDSEMSERPPHWREICVLHSKVNGSNTLLSSFIAYLTTDIHLLKLVMLLSVICPSSSCREYFACNTTAAKNVQHTSLFKYATSRSQCYMDLNSFCICSLYTNNETNVE